MTDIIMLQVSPGLEQLISVILLQQTKSILNGPVEEMKNSNVFFLRIVLFMFLVCHFLRPFAN